MLEFQSFGGVGKWTAATDTDYVEPDNSKFVLINATSATAKAPFSIKVDSDNLTGNAAEVLGGAASNKNWLQVIKNTSDTEGCQVIIDGSNVTGAAAKPSLRIGSGEDGFYSLGAGSVGIAVNGTAVGRFEQSFFKIGDAEIMKETTSATNPVYVFNGDLDTGLGRQAANCPSLIGGGVELLRCETAATLGATETTLWIYDLDNAQIEQVTVGAADSGGAGFKVLRIAN